MNTFHEPPRIAGPVARPKKPHTMPPAGAWDAHAHVFGPAGKFPYTPGRGYTPPDAPVENFVALLDHLGCSHGVVVQGNAHGYDNRVVLDALARYPQRLRGVAITDTRIAPATLRDWHKAGMRGLRFHLFEKKQNYDAASASTCSRYSARPWPSSAGSCRSFATGVCCRTLRPPCA
jgi:2-pyrone-4,6-dicarboxylate lactonase